MYVVFHALCAVLCVAVSACLRSSRAAFSKATRPVLSCLQHIEGHNSSGRAGGKNEQQDYFSVTITAVSEALTTSMTIISYDSVSQACTRNREAAQLGIIASCLLAVSVCSRSVKWSPSSLLLLSILNTETSSCARGHLAHFSFTSPR